METITSRKNALILRLRKLAEDGAYRRELNEYVCDGQKLLEEAIRADCKITSILWKETPAESYSALCSCQAVCPKDLFDYASPMKNSPGPLFTVKIPEKRFMAAQNAIILENVQDPGNVGTVIRTANAFQIDAVILLGDCADLYHPKTVRSTMGAIFRQTVFVENREELAQWLKEQNLRLVGAVLSERAENIRNIDLKRTAVAIGSEGHGMSPELISLCDAEAIIPMNPLSESLNAAAAATVFMWEMAGVKKP